MSYTSQLLLGRYRPRVDDLEWRQGSDMDWGHDICTWDGIGFSTQHSFLMAEYLQGGREGERERERERGREGGRERERERREGGR